VTDSYKKILVIQTAFIGDAILTLPLMQVLKSHYPNSPLDVVVVPRTADLFAHHPALSNIIQYDKRGIDKGVMGFWRLRNRLRAEHYDLIIVPHRSLRSALLTWSLKPAMSIGFDNSEGRKLFKKAVHYDASSHEIERNCSLLGPLNLPVHSTELPRLYPSSDDRQVVQTVITETGMIRYKNIIGLAPGTIWNTKRWPAERFALVCSQAASERTAVVLLGGKEDEALCREITAAAHSFHVFSVAGRLNLLQSAEMIRRCSVVLTNDSAPMHMAVAMQTPVIAIFGATIPGFGFAPRGPHDIVLETNGLPCRPCSIHGGNRCPIKTFDCMLSITPEAVLKKLNLP